MQVRRVTTVPSRVTQLEQGIRVALSRRHTRQMRHRMPQMSTRQMRVWCPAEITCGSSYSRDFLLDAADMRVGNSIRNAAAWDVTYARQFALPFPQDMQYHADAFLEGKANADALAWLARPDCWPARRLAVQGDAGFGKTHLLHVFAQQHRAALMPAEAVRMFMPLSQAPALAIDDADSIVDARALLYLLNTAAELQIPVLMSGRTAPILWRVRLPDLASRLRALSVVTLCPPDDDMLAGLLERLLAERQLRVSEQVQNYMLTHLPRTGAALREAAARLDRLALASGKPVTRAMAAVAVGELPPLEDDSDVVQTDLLLDNTA